MRAGNNVPCNGSSCAAPVNIQEVAHPLIGVDVRLTGLVRLDLPSEQVDAEGGAQADDAADGDESQQPGRVHHCPLVIECSTLVRAHSGPCHACIRPVSGSDGGDRVGTQACKLSASRTAALVDSDVAGRPAAAAKCMDRLRLPDEEATDATELEAMNTHPATVQAGLRGTSAHLQKQKQNRLCLTCNFVLHGEVVIRNNKCRHKKLVVRPA